MMAILDLQQRARELGRIRIGQVVATKSGKTRPAKLDRFRLTSASKPLLDQVAALYGGEVREWQPQGGGAKAWEVITTSTRLPVMVPPQPISQFYELWSGGGCQRRCDGLRELLSEKPCLCDPDPQERACKPTTRLNVVLRDVPGIGVWRLESHGYNAAVELPQSALFLAQVGGYVDGFLSLEARRSKAIVKGEAVTRDFMVPVIEIEVTPAELLAGKASPGQVAVDGNGAAAALGNGQQPAIGAAAPRDYLAEAQAATSIEDVQRIWNEAHAAGHLTAELQSQLKPIGDRLLAAAPQTDGGAGETAPTTVESAAPPPAAATAPPSPHPDADGVVDAEIVDDVESLWAQIVAIASSKGLHTTADLEDDFARHSGGVTAATAGVPEMTAYLQHLRSQP